jgi:hypothetical protein
LIIFALLKDPSGGYVEADGFKAKLKGERQSESPE